MILTHRTDLNPQLKTSSKTMTIGFDVEDIKAGKYVGIDLELLLLIISHMDSNCECFVTQEELAKTLGVTRRTIIKRMQKLVESTVDGKPVIHKEVFRKAGTGSGTHTRYSLPDTNDTEKYTARDVINYWCKAYEEEYDLKYMPNWARDTGMVSNKIVGQYDRKLVEAVIDYVMEHYVQRFGNKQYPKPTIGQLCSWMFNSVAPLVKDSVVEEVPEEQLDQYYENAGEEF